jgi:hypothetical protein
VKWRVLMFREKYPHGVITTEEVYVDLDRGNARYKATVADGEGGSATGYGTETAADFPDFCERAETHALGRALAVLGSDTQFVGQDLTEGEDVADAPVRPPVAQPVNGNSDALPAGDVPDFPPPTVVPADSGLPCGGQSIHVLKPAQLAMLISKTARLVQDEGGGWVPLLHALQRERASRLDRGQRRKVALVPPTAADGPDVPHTIVTTTGEG